MFLEDAAQPALRRRRRRATPAPRHLPATLLYCTFEVAGGNVVASTNPAGASGAGMAGSHIDTVGTGGRYDGNLGVLAGLEVIEATLEADIELARPLAVAFFSNEEGSRYAPDMMGSLAYVGGMSVEAVLQVEGSD